MKSFKYIISSLAVLSLMSCNDFLTEDPRGTQSIENYFGNEEEVAAYVAGCYTNIKADDWWQIENVWMSFDVASDDLWAGNTSQETDLYVISEFRSNQASGFGASANLWQYRYKGIYNCNIGIERIAKAPISEDLRNRYIGELRFLRAYFYFDLVKNFGGVPLYATNLMPDEVTSLRRSSIEDCYAFIEDELKAAAQALPEKSQYSASELGHVTRGAALGILAKAQLYQGKWSECFDNCKKIVDSGEYRLMDNFGDVWSVNTNNNAESIFETQNAYDETYALGSCLTVITGVRGSGPGDGWAWFQPTSDLENAYINAGDTERLRWTIIKCGDTEIAGVNDMSPYLAANTTISEKLLNEWDATYGIDHTKGYIIRPDQHKSARIIRKFFVPVTERQTLYDKQRIPLGLRILRYADVLLMYAESANELGRDDVAREMLNKVRARVNLPEVTVSGNLLRDAIRLERRLELACEFNRIYDLRRWKTQDGQPYMSTIMGQNGSFVRYNAQMLDPFEANNQIESSTAKGIGFRADRDLLFPIPQYEIEKSNGNIEQNPNF